MEVEMYKVTNLTRGRVQIMASGRVTRAGGHEVVSTVTEPMQRLQAAGAISIESYVAPSLAPAESVAPPAPPAPPVPEPKPEPKVVAPPVPVAKPAPPAEEAKPKKAKKAKRAHEDDGTFKADDPATPDVNEAFEAPAEESSDDERARLDALSFGELKEEAKALGLVGRSRSKLVDGILELKSSEG
jgi:outer membrane biosynthesis protein TonB